MTMTHLCGGFFGPLVVAGAWGAAIGRGMRPLLIIPVVMAAATLHAAASCVLGPSIAAISLGLVGRYAIGERLGRNARCASLGNGVAAAVMGTAGYLLSSRSVFLVTCLLVIPTLIALSRIRGHEIDSARAHGAERRDEPPGFRAAGLASLLRQRPLLVFAAAVLGAVVGLQRRVTGGVLGPIVTHLIWSLGMLFLLPYALHLGR